MGPVSNMAHLDEDRYYPVHGPVPQHTGCGHLLALRGGDPCPESHSQYCRDYPAIISLGCLLLFLFVSGIRLSENILIGWQKSFTFLPDCSLIESDK